MLTAGDVVQCDIRDASDENITSSPGSFTTAPNADEIWVTSTCEGTVKFVVDGEDRLIVPGGLGGDGGSDASGNVVRLPNPFRKGEEIFLQAGEATVDQGVIGLSFFRYRND